MKSFKLATVTLLVAAAALSTSAFAKDGTYTASSGTVISKAAHICFISSEIPVVA